MPLGRRDVRLRVRRRRSRRLERYAQPVTLDSPRYEERRRVRPLKSISPRSWTQYIPAANFPKVAHRHLPPPAHPLQTRSLPRQLVVRHVQNKESTATRETLGGLDDLCRLLLLRIRRKGGLGTECCEGA